MRLSSRLIAGLCVSLALTGVLGCSTEADCSLNGDCLSGSCRCDPGWVGASCGTLDLLETPPSAGYFNSSEHSWGGLPVPSPAGNGQSTDWSLFTASFEFGCPLGSWKTNSRVIRAVSHGNPLGPYHFEEQVLPSFAHNPAPRVAPDGTVVLYFIGGWGRTPQRCNGEVAPRFDGGYGFDPNGRMHSASGVDWSPDCGPPPLNDGCGIHMVTAPGPAGPWSPVQYVNVTDVEWACARTNPAAWFLPNGTVFLGMNAGFCHSDDEQLALAWSQAGYGGPYSMKIQGPAIPGNNRDEDPFLWKNKRGWHMLAHGLQETSLEGRLAYSVDGLSWSLSPVAAYNRSIRFTNGTTVEAATVQRPQILFDPESDPADPVPLALWNGVGIGSTANSHTLVRPVNTKAGQAALAGFKEE